MRHLMTSSSGNTRDPVHGRCVISLLLALVVWPALAWADDGWQREFDEAVALAKERGKDILIDFSGTDWCLPCRRLWNETLSKREFIDLASPSFVLLNIDDLARDKMPKDRKQRYAALQEQYGIQAFPTVILATPEGLPYASTGALEEVNNPLAYWRHLKRLYERGQKLKAALSASAGPDGPARAETIVAALAEVRPDFVVRFYSDRLSQLRKMTPSDETGYLAFIDVHAALSALESRLHESFLVTYDKWHRGEAIKSRWVAAFSPRDVDAILERYRPHGATLREALVARCAGHRSETGVEHKS